MIRIFVLTILLSVSVLAQGETLTNQNIIEMSRVGLSTDLMVKKITSARTAFVVTVDALIELKKAGVSDDVIAAMMERNEKALPAEPEKEKLADLAPSELAPPAILNAREAIAAAKTIAVGKSSLQPSRQALEKELMKRKDFQKLNLTILRYKEQADLFVDIGFVSGSWVTHRYVYRIYERRSGAVVAAGETTSWGSLAENLARHISKRLTDARAGKAT
ncbi:MAG TPA: hypothetical protein VFZ23_15435 [Pyrinomonadaceae bacterium]